MAERLQKLIAASGLASRRAAEAMILAGRVTVNGVPVRTLGAKADSSDRIEVDGKALPAPRPRTIALHKPEGFLTTRRDPQGRPTIYDLLPPWAKSLHPVGRLDRDSSGLLLLTNQGGLTLRLTHPRTHLPKVYEVEVEGRLSNRAIRRLEEGILLDDGPTLPAQVKRMSRRRGRDCLQVTLYEGRKRQLRRMLAAVGHPVLRLQRTAIGPLRLDGLAPGAWRELEPEELRRLEEGQEARG